MKTQTINQITSNVYKIFDQHLISDFQSFNDYTEVLLSISENLFLIIELSSLHITPFSTEDFVNNYLIQKQP